MDSSSIERLRIRSLKAQVEASRHYSDSLASQFEAATTLVEQAEIASRYNKALKQTQAMEKMLEMLERKKREADSKKVDA